MAFTLVWGGTNSVIWADRTDTFPYYKGFVPVVVSWFMAPMFSLLVAAFTFLTNRSED